MVCRPRVGARGRRPCRSRDPARGRPGWRGAPSGSRGDRVGEGGPLGRLVELAGAKEAAASGPSASTARRAPLSALKRPRRRRRPPSPFPRGSEGTSMPLCTVVRQLTSGRSRRSACEMATTAWKRWTAVLGSPAPTTTTCGRVRRARPRARPPSPRCPRRPMGERRARGARACRCAGAARRQPALDRQGFPVTAPPSPASFPLCLQRRHCRARRSRSCSPPAAPREPRRLPTPFRAVRRASSSSITLSFSSKT